MSFTRRLMAGIAAFREAYLASDDEHEDDFESLEARQLRYKIYWSMYENQSYNDVHRWAPSFRHERGMYKDARNIFNPALRIGDFFSAHCWAGRLDFDAGTEGAVPITTENDRLRDGLGVVWRDSNFSILKDVISLRGAILGDTFIHVTDDTEKERVYLEVISPSVITDLIKDAYGNVRGYTVEYDREDENGREVQYRLEVSRDGDYVVYETFRNNEPFGWDGQPAVWAEPYGFVPLVHIQHKDVGLEYGWSELHGIRNKIVEVDDLASMISDHVRKSISPVWLLTGGRASDLEMGGSQDDDKPYPRREELQILTAPEGSKFDPVVSDLNIADALEYITKLLEELERDAPELQKDIWTASDVSGRALAIARQRVATKVNQRRENYDNGLVRAQKMALSIGGMRNYREYTDFNERSYEQGDLEHNIADRPVFEQDEGLAVETSQKFWEAANIAVQAGASLEGYLQSEGWSEEQITDIIGVETNPWDAFKEGDEWCVYEVDEDGNKTGESYGCHPTQAEALEQVKALHANAD